MSPSSLRGWVAAEFGAVELSGLSGLGRVEDWGFQACGVEGGPLGFRGLGA